MMSGSVKLVVRAWSAVLVGAVLTGAPLTSSAEDVFPDELRRCSSIDDASARLACYDGLASREAPAQVQPGASSKPTPDQALDDLGSETLRRDNDEKDEKLAVRASVISCRKDAFDRYLFYFENGQVWKQSSDKRLYLKDCLFDVTITKDFFGYKMLRDGEKRPLRISRVK